jgi:hypothetical protein
VEVPSATLASDDLSGSGPKYPVTGSRRWLHPEADR